MIKSRKENLTSEGTLYFYYLRADHVPNDIKMEKGAKLTSYPAEDYHDDVLKATSEAM